MRIPKGTVFVVGAGCSKAYGFPTGGELLLEIGQALATNPRGTPGSLMVDLAEVTENRVREFGRNLLQSGCLSVDEFVQHQQSATRMAKVAIAARLLVRETDSATCPDGASFARETDWLGHLLKHILDDGQDGLASVRFITFNFDRVIERRIAASLSSRFQMDDQAAGKTVCDLANIVHMNGSFGNLQQAPDGGDDESCSWGGLLPPDKIKKAAQRLRFVHEGPSEDIKHAQEWIAEAPMVAFLGFGFHPVNRKSLAFTEDVPHKHVPFVGSGYGMTSSEARGIELNFGRALALYEGFDALSFLRGVPNLNGYGGQPGFGFPSHQPPTIWGNEPRR